MDGILAVARFIRKVFPQQQKRAACIDRPLAQAADTMSPA